MIYIFRFKDIFIISGHFDISVVLGFFTLFFYQKSSMYLTSFFVCIKLRYRTNNIIIYINLGIFSSGFMWSVFSKCR